MPIRHWLSSVRGRRGFAASLIVLSLGGLVLLKTPASANHTVVAEPSGPGTTKFQGPGAHGTFALSQSKLMTGEKTPLFAELRFAADEGSPAAGQRAPLTLAVVLD